MGPAELTSTDSRQPGVPIDTQADLDHWMSIQDSRDRAEPFTFIVDLDGRLRVAAGAPSTWSVRPDAT